ncbi:MAG TPA: hypothetical protein VI670_06255 [Thermoanaerobaculia bacterium]|jgi:hypothetical protein
MKRILIATAISVLAVSALAELWAPLEDLVKMSPVIAKAKALREIDDRRELEIVEVWAGSKDDIKLNDAGHFVTLKSEPGMKDLAEGQEIVLFFSPNRGRKLDRNGCGFPVVDGKIIYAPTSDEYYAEYTLEELERKVLEIVKP